MPLEVTPGAEDADSFASVEEADAHITGFHTEAEAEAWSDSEELDKESALRRAAMILSSGIVWTGSPTTEEQALPWPRTGMLSRNGFAIDDMVIPIELKRAQAELARILVGEDLTADDDVAKQGISELKAGSIGLKFRDRTLAEEMALKEPETAYLSKMIPDVVRMLLVPSWYERSGVSTDGEALFEVIR